jgi:hypothetical protein
VDLSISCLVVALAEFVGVLESAFVGEALDERIDGLAKFAECSQGDSSNRGDSPERSEDRRASRGAPNASSAFFAFASYSEGARSARRSAARTMRLRLRRR